MAPTIHTPSHQARPPRPGWRLRSDRAICAEECGARCCKASTVVLTPAEARQLEDRAQALGLAPPQIAPYGEPAGASFVMYAQPCTFLNKANRCLVYRDRPEHCRAFPRQVLEWCLISQKPQSR